MQRLTVIVMGVAGSGKSTIGKMIADKLGVTFIDGDTLHPVENVEKMSNGIPLGDEERKPWLNQVRDAASKSASQNQSIVIACSALKKKYRDRIRTGNPGLRFLFLHGRQALILQRIQERSGHFMREEMLASQFMDLEKPNGEADVITIDIEQSIEEVVESALLQLQRN